jgi:putative ABC transport system ATP-binding protein
VLRIRQLSRSFREGGRVHQVLTAAQAEIAPGQVVAVTGRSGSGKSTLLNLVSGIDAPDAGQVEFDGEDVTAMAEPARTLFRRTHVGFIYQFFNLIPTLDAEENVRLVLELNGIRGREAAARSRAALAEVGLAGRESSAVDQLSGGEQQRVAIARAVVHAPRLLLADEPTGNLDEATADDVLSLARDLVKRSGCGFLMVTHSARLAATLDRQVRLHAGLIA